MSDHPEDRGLSPGKGRLLAESILTLEPRPGDWLDDHRIGGVRIVPAAVTAIWMLEALRGSGASPVAALSRVRWLRPLRCGDGGLRVCIRVRRHGEDERRSVEVSAPRLRRDGSLFGHAVHADALEETDAARPPLPEPLPRARTLSRLPPSFQGPYWRHLGAPLHLGETGAAAPLAHPERIASLPPPPTLTGDPPLDPRILDALFQLAGAWRELEGADRGVPAAAGALRVVWGSKPERGLTLHARGRPRDPVDLTLLAGSRAVLQIRGYEAAHRRTR